MAMQTVGSGMVLIPNTAAAPTYGSYGQLIASTGFDAKWLIVAPFTGGANPEMQLSIGPSGAPTHILSGHLSSSGWHSMRVAIPSGSEIIARSRAVLANAQSFVSVILSDIDLTAEATQSVSAGHKTVTTGVAVNAEGSPTELIASLPFDATFMLLSVYERGSHNNTLITLSLDIMTGASTFEVPIINDISKRIFRGGSGHHSISDVLSMPVEFSAGDRISIRGKDDLNHSHPIEIGCTFFG